MNFIKQYLPHLEKLCDAHHVEELYVFGSAVSENFRKDSDIDFLVEFGEIEVMDYLDNYIGFKKSLKNLFKRNIDLVEKQTLKNPIFIRSINRNKQKLYGRKDLKVTL